MKNLIKLLKRRRNNDSIKNWELAASIIFLIVALFFVVAGVYTFIQKLFIEKGG
ncbi:hypothetical protein ASZ90_004274 [hydrocarbon metagenome]|uniref:Uncharacterized protein n=1 Tax=hydrocarbon metagenome TaxID=938273 RepID=A0A0W8FY92_9ZZZZ